MPPKTKKRARDTDDSDVPLIMSDTPDDRLIPSIVFNDAPGDCVIPSAALNTEDAIAAIVTGMNKGTRPSVIMDVIKGAHPSTPRLGNGDLLDGQPTAPKKKSKKKKKKKKKTKAELLALAGVVISIDLIDDSGDTWRPRVCAKDKHLLVTRDISIGEELVTFATVVSTPTHPHEGSKDKQGNVNLAQTTGVHMLQMFTTCGYQWEGVARRLMPKEVVDEFILNREEEIKHMIAGNSMVVGQTIGTLMALLLSSDKWVVEQLGSIQKDVDAELLLLGVDPWLYAVIYAMRVSNTHDMVDPIFNHGHQVMSTHPGLTRVFSLTGAPKDFNAVMVLGRGHKLHVFAMRPIPRGGRVVVVFSDGMAVNSGDQTNLNILNLLMALRKMTGETFDAKVMSGVLEQLGSFDLPNDKTLPTALQHYMDKEDQETFERVRKQIMNIDIFKRSLASYEQRARQLRSEAKTKTAAIHDTVVALLGTINLHASNPEVWLDTPDVVDDELMAPRRTSTKKPRVSKNAGKSYTQEEAMDLSDSSDSDSDDGSVSSDGSAINDEDFSELMNRGKPKQAKQRVRAPVGVKRFIADATMDDIEPYCMFTAVLLCSNHAELDDAYLPWIPDGVLANLDRGSDISRVSKSSMLVLLNARIDSELKSIQTAFDQIDSEFIAKVTRETKMTSLTSSASEMVQMMSVLSAGAEADDKPSTIPEEEEDDDEAKAEEVDGLDVNELVAASFQADGLGVDEIVIVPELLTDELTEDSDPLSSPELQRGCSTNGGF